MAKIAVSEEAVALERLLARIRTRVSELVSLDAYDRWGAQDDAAKAEVREESAAAAADKGEAEVKLKALVARLRRESPAVLDEWIDAHTRLLECFLAEQGDDASKKTERLVAEGELREWEKVRAGEIPFVDGNTFYVRFDPELYAALFGFTPGR